VRQSFELAAHFVSPAVHPKPFRVYSSPFYRCLQTIQPAVEALKEAQQRQLTTGTDHGIDAAAELDVRIENGVGCVLLPYILPYTQGTIPP
jgi:transcription factor C subunit 7